jgi:hypothetical protein
VTREARLPILDELEIRSTLERTLYAAGWQQPDRLVAQEAVTELVYEQQLTNPVEIMQTARELAEDPACAQRFADRLLERERASQNRRSTSRASGPVPRTNSSSSPHTVNRSNTRAPGARWDHEQDDRQQDLGGL